jgi:hypothetical protein
VCPKSADFILIKNYYCWFSMSPLTRFPANLALNFLNILKYYQVTIVFSIALPPHSGPRPLIQFRNHFSQTVGLLGRVNSPSQGRYLNTGQHKHRINAYTHQTSMPWVGFELTIPASERAKTVHASDCAATVTGSLLLYYQKLFNLLSVYFSSYIANFPFPN